MKFSTLICAAASVATVQAEFIIRGDYLTWSRMDPIVNPGAIGGHLHSIIGASNFRTVLNSPDEMNQAQCTTANVAADKSNYWHPNLFFINPNGTYSPLISSNRIYYHLQNNENVKYNAFPPGFRMLTGNAMRRDPGDIRVQGLRIKYSHDGPQTKYILNGTMQPNAPNEIHMIIHFPSCGLADQTLDSDDHFSHVTWPVHSSPDKDLGPMWTMAGSVCPDTHPIRYPQIMMEVQYRVEPYMKEVWNKQGSNFILANGDTTGLTWHADFVNGWDVNILQQAIDQCSSVGSALQNCAPFRDIYQDTGRHDCRMQGQIPNEDVGIIEPLKELPGCNLHWDWDGPVDKPACKDTKDPGFITPKNGFSGPLSLNIPVALPEGAGNGTEVSAGIGRFQNWFTPRFGPWAEEWCSHGGFQCPDKGAIQLKALDDTPAYNAMKPVTKINLAAATRGAGDFHATRPYQCDPGEAMPCPAGGAAAYSTAAAAASGSASGSAAAATGSAPAGAANLLAVHDESASIAAAATTEMYSIAGSAAVTLTPSTTQLVDAAPTGAESSAAPRKCSRSRHNSRRARRSSH